MSTEAHSPLSPATLAERLVEEGPLLARICARLSVEVAAVGLPTFEIDVARAECSLSPDSFSGDTALLGRWPADQSGRRGSFNINGDGSFFAEYDVLANLPVNPRRFVEATTAWGRGERIRAELRILDWPEEDAAA